MTTGPKVLSDAAERKQEPLGLPRAGEAFHHRFPDAVAPIQTSIARQANDPDAGYPICEFTPETYDAAVLQQSANVTSENRSQP